MPAHGCLGLDGAAAVTVILRLWSGSSAPALQTAWPTCSAGPHSASPGPAGCSGRCGGCGPCRGQLHRRRRSSSCYSNLSVYCQQRHCRPAWVSVTQWPEWLTWTVLKVTLSWLGHWHLSPTRSLHRDSDLCDSVCQVMWPGGHRHGHCDTRLGLRAAGGFYFFSIYWCILPQWSELHPGHTTRALPLSRGGRVQTGDPTISSPTPWPIGHDIPFLTILIRTVWKVRTWINKNHDTNHDKKYIPW